MTETLSTMTEQEIQSVQLMIFNEIFSKPDYVPAASYEPFLTVAHRAALKTVQEHAAAKAEGREVESFLRSHLKMWMDSGIPAPLNELQSISGWLRTSAEGMRPMQMAMRNRIILLLREVAKLSNEGIEAEIREGIYDERPDLLEERVNSLPDSERIAISLVRKDGRTVGGTCTHPLGCTSCSWCGFGLPGAKEDTEE